MLFDLIKKWRGKEEVVMTDTRQKCNDRRKTLIKGNRGGIKGQQTEYVLRPTSSNEKSSKGPNTQKFSGGDSQRGPKLVKRSS